MEPEAPLPEEEHLVEGVDYYLEGDLLVLTRHYLLERGWCCRNGCRHCPYGFQGDGAPLRPPSPPPTEEHPDQGRLPF